MKSIKAIWNGAVLAESDETVVVEGNHYFPSYSLHREYFQATDLQTTCPWKGKAHYLNIVVEGEVNEEACWYYPTPNKEASRIKDYFAFWKNIEIIKETKEERNKKIADTADLFLAQIQEITSQGEKTDLEITKSVTSLLNQMGTDALNHCLPPDFIHSLSFFNFDNSTTACFYTDHDLVIQKVNPTFSWNFNHLEEPVGLPLKKILTQMGMEQEELDQFTKQLNSHGWVKIPKIRVEKKDEILYFSIDVAIIKHGDLDSLSGVQGQFIDITQEVLLQKEIEEKNEELAQFNQEVQELLDNTGQGFLAFGNDYLIQKKYSKACLTFFGKPIENLHSLKLLLPGEDNNERRKAAGEVLDMLFSGIGEIAMVEDLLPGEVSIEQRILQLEYRWIPAAESYLSDKIMVIITDVTVEKELEAQLKVDEERNRTLIKIASDRDGFLEFLRELRRLFQNINNCINQDSCELIDPNELFRYYHTIKGGAASYALQKISSEAHRIESNLEEVRSGEKLITPEIVSQLKQKTERLQQVVDESLSEFDQLIPEEERQQDEKIYKVTSSKLIRFEEQLLSIIDSDYLEQVKRAIIALKMQPIGPVLKKYALTAEALAEKLEKQVKVELSGLELEVDQDRLAPLFSTLIHLVRNSIDHGLEEAEVRSMLGKSETGFLKISARQTSENLIISIQDDGGGVDPEIIKSVALSKNIITEEWSQKASKKEMIELIFAPGFSTKEAVSDVSGRGVGIDAVKSSIDELHGKMMIDTELDQGTTFTISIPVVG